MQTHDDESHSLRGEFLKRLRERADAAQKAAASTITTGAAGEKSLADWKSNDIHCRLMPNDEQGILRISIGGGENMPVRMNYCTIRGEVGECIALLEKAIVALRNCPG